MKLHTLEYSNSQSIGNFWIDPSRRLRIEEYRGLTELRDLRQTIFAMADDPDWFADYHGLIDFSSAELELSANDVIRLGLLMRQGRHQTTGWLTFVVTDPTTRGIVRMLGYWSRTTDRQRIFTSRLEAENWLELNRLQVPPRCIEEDLAGLQDAC